MSNQPANTDFADPVGQGDYVVQDGDCISSIAVKSGHFWETIWNDPANSELKQIRKDPNVLLPSDRVTIPPIRRRDENGATEKRHRFRRLGEPSRLRLQFKMFGEPRANEPFRIDVDGRTIKEGRLDGDGCLDVGISGNARMARVLVGEDEDLELFELQLGGVDPVADLRGVRERLFNLGYPCPQGTGELDNPTRIAIAAFQKDQHLPLSGDLDETTRQALLKVHRS